jgi:alpha-1,3-rhamnosyl/mannosyltransferase
MKKQHLFIEATAIVPEKMSGIGHAVLQIVKELDRTAYQSDYVVTVFVPLGEGRALQRYAFKNIHVRELPLPHKVFSLLSRFTLGIPLDIFLGRGVYIFPNYRNWNLLFSKSLTFFHDISYLIFPQFTQPRNLQYLNKNIRKWLNRTDIVVTISKSSKEEIDQGLQPLPRGEAMVVELGVDPGVFYPKPTASVSKTRKKYDLPVDYFLYIGNIEPRKNLEFLVNAYASNEELKRFPLFLIGGDGWLNEPIVEAISQANAKGYTIVRNKSYVPDEDLPDLISGSRAVLLPSHHEGFGLSVVQAEACGVPVVASDIPVLREIGHNSLYYFKNDNVASFNKAMHEVLETKADKKPQVHYTWTRTVNKLLELVQDLR